MADINNTFPYEDSKGRLAKYELYEKLLAGNHFSAFAGEVGKEITDRYKNLRYITANFAGLISKVIADLLFGEEIQIKAGKNTDFLDALYLDSKLRVQIYESALFNSARGDAIFRLRVEDNNIIVEDINPSMYFPRGTSNNFRAKPRVEELAWKNTIGDTTYLISEIQEKGILTTNIHILEKDGQIGGTIDIPAYNNLAGTKYQAVVDSKIGKNLLVHVPNMRLKSDYFGTSDYADLLSLFYAINNRLSKTDNILDKHSDPILAVPEGVLDEEGNVKREALSMIEMGTGDTKPEYIVWNASLDSAFKQVDKLVEMLFMASEVSPDVLGMGQGQSDSGRALKFKLIRTIAKRQRKALYYAQALKEVFILAQELAIKNGFTVNGVKIAEAKAIEPEIIFSDGIVNDPKETIENETMKVESGLTSKKRAIMAIENTDEKNAEAIIKEIEDEKPEPPSFLTNPIDNESTNIDNNNSNPQDSQANKNNS